LNPSTITMPMPAWNNPMVYRISELSLRKEIERVGIDTASLPIFEAKSKMLFFKLTALSSPAANIIKQEMLSAGGDAAVHRHAINCKIEKTDVILMGTRAQISRAARKLLQMNYWGLRETGEALLAQLKQKAKEWGLRGKTYNMEENTYLMGIINVTPDSFYRGSRINPERAGEIAERMAEEGADFIDIGGESTRPGAEPVPLEEELKRVVPAVREVRKRVDLPISVDTYKAEVARAALEEGADIINDISALRFDPAMAEVAARYKVPVILMHIKGKPRDMQKSPHYEDAVKEILLFLKERAAFAQEAGIENIAVDPGIGFGKRLEDNLEILRSIEAFASLGYPVLVGHSRKSFIGVLTGAEVEERAAPSASLTFYLALKGVSLIRVHDIKINKMSLDLAKGIKG